MTVSFETQRAQRTQRRPKRLFSAFSAPSAFQVLPSPLAAIPYRFRYFATLLPKRTWAMPHTPSAKKSMRQDEKRRLRNKATRKTIRLALRQVDEAVKGGAADQIKKDALVAIRAL